jgi:acyl carrier protein
MTDYRDAIANFFETELDLESGSYKDDELLFSTGRLDSFGLVNLLTFVEGKLGRRLRTAETTLANFDSIARLAAFMAAGS